MVKSSFNGQQVAPFSFLFSNSLLLYMINVFLGPLPCSGFTPSTLAPTKKIIISRKRSEHSSVCGSQAPRFRVSCCSASCRRCVFSAPGFHVKRSGPTLFRTVLGDPLLSRAAQSETSPFEGLFWAAAEVRTCR